MLKVKAVAMFRRDGARVRCARPLRGSEDQDLFSGTNWIVIQDVEVSRRDSEAKPRDLATLHQASSTKQPTRSCLVNWQQTPTFHFSKLKTSKGASWIAEMPLSQIEKPSNRTSSFPQMSLFEIQNKEPKWKYALHQVVHIKL